MLPIQNGSETITPTENMLIYLDLSTENNFLGEIIISISQKMMEKRGVNVLMQVFPPFLPLPFCMLMKRLIEFM